MLRMRSYAIGCLIALLALILSTVASAQSRSTTAELTGTVRDASHAVLPGAIVTATSVDTNIARTVTSDAEGRYLLAGLPRAGDGVQPLPPYPRGL